MDHDAPAVTLAPKEAVVSITLKDDLTRLVKADYAVDGGAWTPVFPDDELFDAREEKITLRIPDLKRGTHLVMVRATDCGRECRHRRRAGRDQGVMDFRFLILDLGFRGIRSDGLDRRFRARRGVTAAEVLVLLALFVLTVLVILMVLPRGREHARMAGCQNNLAHVGFALALHDQLEHRLPGTEGMTGSEPARDARTKSPLRTLLEAFEQGDLLGIADAKTRPAPRPGEVPGEMPVRGFVCGSDPNATSGLFAAPISYRACTGDVPEGENGAFAPGRTISMREIQERDGLGYTAAFSERLAGDNRKEHPAPFNYSIVDGPLTAEGCAGPAELSRWRGDAGSSWYSCDYRSTLYNHALAPNGQPSCILSTGQAAFMGASSGHVTGVNLLLLDGRVTVVRPSIDLKIWKEFARIGSRDSGSDVE